MSRLSELYTQADQLNEENPAELARKITLYTDILEVVSKAHAASYNEYGLAYSRRKYAYAEAIVDTEGTGVVKEAAAELNCAPYRSQEVEADSKRQHWLNIMDSTKETINALKKQLDILQMEYRGGK